MYEVGPGSGDCEVAVQARTGSGVLLGDKWRCRMISDEWCVLCDSE